MDRSFTRIIGGLWFTSAIVLSGCGAKSSAPAASPAGSEPSASGQAPSGPQGEKGDIQTLDKREAAAQGMHPFSGSGFQGEVESSAAPTVTPATENSAMKVEVPLGGSVEPITCWIYPQPIDPGQQLSQVLQGAAKSVSMKLIVPKEVAVVGDEPAIYVDGQYVTEGDKGKLFGIVKLMVYPKDDTPLLCLHDQVGYHDTFKRVTAGLAASMKKSGATPKTPRFVELSVVTIGDTPVGFSRQAIFDAVDGGKVMQTRETSLIPRSPTELTASDTARDEAWDTKGRIEEISYAQGQGGELSDQVVAKRGSGPSYKFEGTHLGKKISGTFKTKTAEGLLGDIELWSRTKKLMTGAAPELHYEIYDPSTDPTSPLTVSLKPLSRPDHTLKGTLGKVEATLFIDADGRTEKFEASIGSGVLKSQRVFSHGSP